MKAALLVPSKFMVSREFGTGTIPASPLVTITEVKLEKQEKEMWGLLYFKEKWAKPLKINATHCKALVQMFGDETTGWHGKRVGLYALPGTFFGERGTAVRISGSPDIKSPISFTVKKFGGGKDTYHLRVLNADGAFDPALYVPYGAQQGQRYEDLEPDALTATLIEYEKKLELPEAKKQPVPKWLPRVQLALKSLGAERERRLTEKAPTEPPPETEETPPAEPGSGG